MSGHLCINKTYHKIINHFYWRSLKSDVSKYCKTCHTCQMPKAQLQPIPAFDEPFSGILVDCVGPLPRTGSGSGCLLTIMCTSTRFPEAIPLGNIKTKSIVGALIKFLLDVRNRFGLVRGQILCLVYSNGLCMSWGSGDAGRPLVALGVLVLFFYKKIIMVLIIQFVTFLRSLTNIRKITLP